MHTAIDLNQNLNNLMTITAQQVVGFNTSFNTWQDSLAVHFHKVWIFIPLEAWKAWCTLTREKQNKLILSSLSYRNRIWWRIADQQFSEVDTLK